MPTTIRIVSNRFPEIARRMPQIARQIVQETVQEVEDYAKTVVPVDTGALRASIQSEVTGTEGAVYTDMFYAPFVEFSTVKMPAQPFMTPAAEAARQGFDRKTRNLESRLD
jgi:HK97 gp10 family phage protein